MRRIWFAGILWSMSVQANLNDLRFLVVTQDTHANHAEQNRYWTALGEPSDRLMIHRWLVESQYLKVTKWIDERITTQEHFPERLSRLQEVRNLIITQIGFRAWGSVKVPKLDFTRLRDSQPRRRN